MSRLRVPRNRLEHVQRCAREREIETCAVGLVHQVEGGDAYVVRGFDEVPAEAYLFRSATQATLRPEYLVDVVNRAKREKAGVVLAHTHVNGIACAFSVVDDEGEESLSKYLNSRLPDRTHVALLITAEGLVARELGTVRAIPVVGIGGSLQTSKAAGTTGEGFDRQVRAFGVEGQLAIHDASVAVVGLGGTGSVVAQQLAHLGVRRLTLVDPDRVEPTNLNRLIGATPQDVGALKVAVAARHARQIGVTSIDEVPRDVVEDDVAISLAATDFIFCCTDSMASRAVLNQLAYQYLVPCIDVGVAIHVTEGTVRYIAGRVQMLAPGLPCLVCTDKLDAEAIRREMLSPEQRAADPYIVGAAVPQPAVISLNSMMSSAAVTMFLSAVAGIPGESRMQIYDGVRGALRPATMTPVANCIACSHEGALARGGSWQLPTRK
jgi:molybdopterin-synthase adenylyltransferase